MKILIVKPSALGDVIQSLPVLNGLRSHWPDARIDWIVSDHLTGILEGHPSISNLILYPRKRWTVPWRLHEALTWAGQLRATAYDMVIDLQGLLRSGLMTWATGSPRRIGLRSAREGSRFAYTEVVEDNAVAAAQRYLQVLQHLKVPADPLDFRLPAPAPLPAPLTDGKPYVVLHPYSQWTTKLWPYHYYRDLAQSATHVRFVTVGIGTWFPIGYQPGSDRIIDFRSRLTLPQLVSVLNQAKAVISTDSGPAHIAAALHRPTLVLFGATDPLKTTPVGKNVTVFTSAFNCSPCLKRNCSKAVPVECMSAITIERPLGWLRTNLGSL